MQLYAHSTLKDVHGMPLQPQNCITKVCEWYTLCRQQLNNAKTELVWLTLHAHEAGQFCLLVGGNII